MSARDQILERLRSQRGFLPRVTAVTETNVTAVSREEAVDRFVVEAAALGIDCHLESSSEGVQRRVESLARGSRTLSWDRHHVPYDALRHVTEVSFGAAPKAMQAEAHIGITGCDAAIAETGSLVLFSGPGRARTVSLLPPIHVAVVERAKLCFTMAEMFATHRERLADSASCTIITGPSRTADIELTLTLGIHGPGQVIVVLGP